uniref:Ig-like domain-containing protein n=2 Tax=Paracidobacterium acidisoli TaxID=2303751 RepID=A0A372ITP8_9BACT
MVFLVTLLESTLLASAAVVVSPAAVQVKPGAQVQFSATGSADNIVIWSLSGAGCVGITCGEITADGLYTAPAAAPNPSAVTVVATSLADVTQSGTAMVTVGAAASVGVTLSPTSVTIGQNGQQQFSAGVTGTSNTAVSWSVSGVGCVAGSCGTITAAGLYTAPAVVPNPSLATVTATSAADTSKSASATVVIELATTVSVSVSPLTAQVGAGKQQQFSATVKGSTNAAVRWSLAGAGCSGSACGTISSSGLYTAPAAIPASPAVSIIATAVAAPSQSGKATVTIVAASSGLVISPLSPQVKPGGQVQFAASGSGSGVVIWSDSGSGCTGIACGSINASGLYTAPATAPNPATIVVTATSLSNPAMSASTTVTILTSSTQVSVSVTPGSIQLNTGAQQLFKAAVTGNSNTSVTWSVSGFGCVGSACGTITTGGLYTAPSTLPNPSLVNVTATSVADPTKSSTATVVLEQQVAVTISPTSAQLGIGAAQQFSAKVTGTSVSGVTWSVSGSGCAGAACGTINPGGLYTAPDTVPNPAQVTVTATAIADGVTSASALVTIIVPIQVTISPADAIVTVSTQQQFRATVSGTKNTAVTWSVSGPGCSGAACGTVTAAGLYTAPASVPNPASVTVKAASQANTSSFAAAAVTITPTNNSKLNGQYAFLFTGFDSNGVYQSAGSFTADGQGKITSGLEDVNNSAGSSTDLSIAGTYQLGGDNRGMMTISSPAGTHTYRFSLNLLGTKGRFISFDSTGVRGSGVIELQTPAAFDASVLSGGYAFSLTGMDVSGSRIGALGLIFPSGSGFISGSSLDVNDGGIVSPTFATFDGIYDVDDATGRGTATLSIPGFDGGTFNFAFYIVSANEFLMISTDPLSFDNPIFSGPAEFQNGAPFTSASLNGGSVFNLSGTNGSAPQDTVGRLQFDGSQGVTMIFDQNSGGNVTVAGVLNGAYDMELNGRGTINLADPSTGTTTIWYLYAFGQNSAFLMDASTGAVAIGEMKQQQIIPPFSNADILGTYIFGSGEPIEAATPLFSGIANFDGGNSIQGQGSVTGTEDLSQSSSLTLNLGLGGTYSVSSVSNNGRGAILLTSPSGRTIAVWVASTSECFGLDVDAAVTEPTILHFEQ